MRSSTPAAIVATTRPAANASNAPLGCHHVHRAPKTEAASRRANAAAVPTTDRPVESCDGASRVVANAGSTPSVAA